MDVFVDSVLNLTELPDCTELPVDCVDCVELPVDWVDCVELLEDCVYCTEDEVAELNVVFTAALPSFVLEVWDGIKERVWER